MRIEINDKITPETIKLKILSIILTHIQCCCVCEAKKVLFFVCSFTELEGCNRFGLDWLVFVESCVTQLRYRLVYIRPVISTIRLRAVIVCVRLI